MSTDNQVSDLRKVYDHINTLVNYGDAEPFDHEGSLVRWSGWIPKEGSRALVGHWRSNVKSTCFVSIPNTSTCGRSSPHASWNVDPVDGPHPTIDDLADPNHKCHRQREHAKVALLEMIAAHKRGLRAPWVTRLPEHTILAMWDIEEGGKIHLIGRLECGHIDSNFTGHFNLRDGDRALFGEHTLRNFGVDIDWPVGVSVVEQFREAVEEHAFQSLILCLEWMAPSKFHTRER